MEKEFVTYQQAIKLKALGFDEPCFGFYLEDGTWTPSSYSREGTVYPSNTDLLPEWCAAPLYQQAFRWFREKYDCHHTIKHNKKYVGIAYSSVVNFSIDEFETYEEAELACLEKLIEIVEAKSE